MHFGLLSFTIIHRECPCDKTEIWSSFYPSSSYADAFLSLWLDIYFRSA